MSGPRSIEGIVRFLKANKLKPGDRIGNRVWDGTTWHQVEPYANSPLEQQLRGHRLPQRMVDPIARLAELWNSDGRHALLASGKDHRALLAMAGLEFRLAQVPWKHLEEYQRRALVMAAREAVELGRACAWAFGEGQGA